MNGQVIRVISNLYTVKAGDQLYGCSARGIFRKNDITPVVGDNVVIDIDNNVILKILPRKNELERPVIANVDAAIIVTSLKKPNLDLTLLDKLISIITYNSIEPAIVFTKADLISDDTKKMVDTLKDYYEMIGIKVFYNTEVAEIKRFIKNKVVVLAGQTGAGKSSLLNRLDEDLDIETNEISEALGRGKHTTRHVELYEIAEGFIADTPGFSALDLKDISKEDLKFTFVEFDNAECKFRDCLHKKEVGCKVKEMVDNKEILKSRYDNYLKFLEELEK